MLLAVSIGPPVASAHNSGWVYIDASKLPFVFENGRSQIIQGAVGPDGRCAGTFTIDHAPGTPSVTAVELGANPSTCQQLVEVGTASPDPSPSQGLTYQKTFPLGDQPQGALAPSVSQAHGDLYTSWHDPIWIVVTSVDDVMSWRFDGSTIQGIVSAYDLIGYLSVPHDHWYVTYHPAPVLQVDINDRWATLTSNARFYNTDFCGGTGTTYQNNTLTALPSGGDRGSVSTWDYGCDANFLTWIMNLH